MSMMDNYRVNCPHCKKRFRWVHVCKDSSLVTRRNVYEEALKSSLKEKNKDEGDS